MATGRKCGRDLANKDRARGFVDERVHPPFATFRAECLHKHLAGLGFIYELVFSIVELQEIARTTLGAFGGSCLDDPDSDWL